MSRVYCSVAKLYVTPLTNTPGSAVLHYLPSLLKFMSMLLSNHLILCFTLLSPSIFLSIRVFSVELAFPIMWPKYWNFSFSISPSNEYSGLISSRIDWFDLLAVQGSLKSFLQHHNSKASILRHWAFLMVQFTHPSMTTGKTIALTMQTFVSKVMSLLFNTLSVCHGFPSSEQIPLMSWLQSPSTVILETKKQISHCFHFFPFC